MTIEEVNGFNIMRILTFILIIIIAIFGLSFALLNATPVSFNYYVGTVTLSLSLLLILCLGLGIIVGMILLIPSLIRLKNNNYRLRKESALSSRTK